MPRKTRAQALGDSSLLHVMSRCARSMLLLQAGEGEATTAIPEPRKQWFYDRLRLLHAAFAIDVQGFAIMGNHFHLVVRLCPRDLARWSAREVVERWAKVHPPRDGKYRPREADEAWIAERLADPAWVEATRAKLGSISQFMKDLKQPIAERINKLEGAVGHFWQGRFKAVPIESEEQHVAALAYVDLNPFAAGQGKTPEEPRYTSLHERARAYRESRSCKSHKSRQARHARGQSALWFAPLDDPSERSALPRARPGASPGPRPGLVPGPVSGDVFCMRVADYLKLVDGLARCVRRGRRRLDARAERILDRLDLDPGELLRQFQRFTGPSMPGGPG